MKRPFLIPVFQTGQFSLAAAPGSRFWARRAAVTVWGAFALLAAVVQGQPAFDPFGPVQHEIAERRRQELAEQRLQQAVNDIAARQIPDAEARQMLERNLFVSDRAFNVTVFGNQRTPEATQQSLRMQLVDEIRAINQVCSLTEPQLQKLRLAGQGDLTRYFHRVEELRRRFLASGSNPHAYHEVVAQLSWERRALEFGIYGDTSLLRKTLLKTLNDGQLVRFQELKRERQRANVEYAVQYAVRSLRGLSGFRLGDARGQQIIQLLMDEANPPSHSGSYTANVILFHAAKLEPRLKPLLDESEWMAFQQGIQMSQRIVPQLQRAGLLAEDE